MIFNPDKSYQDTAREEAAQQVRVEAQQNSVWFEASLHQDNAAKIIYDRVDDTADLLARILHAVAKGERMEGLSVVQRSFLIAQSVKDIFEPIVKNEAESRVEG